MELRHSRELRDGVMTAERYSRGLREVNVTEIIFDETEQLQRLPELFLSGRGVMNDYVRVYGPGRIALDRMLCEADIFQDIERGKTREKFRRYTEVVSPLLNDVSQILIIHAHPYSAPV